MQPATPRSAHTRLRRALALGTLLTGLGTAAFAFNLMGLPIPGTINDFFQPGSQPGTLNATLLEGQNCANCHGFYDPAIEPYERWQGSMMAQATRDPVFHACLAIANQDIGEAGDLCLRCHTPVGWMGGRSTPTDGSALDPMQGDFDGVNCHFCHRMVDGDHHAGVDPAEDLPILNTLAMNGELPPKSPHSGQYILDPDDRRRGPFDLGSMFFWHEWLESPFHQESRMCGTCHDVSNPGFTRQADGTYALNAYDTPHPTHDKLDAFPVERTFSEWAKSDFARAEIDMGGRFGGNKMAVATCQDCHMPDASGTACAPGFGGEFRDDMPLHDFAGANSWVLRAVRSQYPDAATGLNQQIEDDAIARNVSMLQRAADLHAWEEGGNLIVRVLNQTGHKLPTGYPEGRRMWLNVNFFNIAGDKLDEFGAYDFATATLTTDDTKVFEAKLGMDEAVATAAGLQPGESFHFVLNNLILKDNRIPPRGYSFRAFESVQAQPVDAHYVDQQYWSDTIYNAPPAATRAVVKLYYQTTSKEYIEFLRDENTTNQAGQIAYDEWVLHGMSEPVEMASIDIQLETGPCPPPIPYGLASKTSSGSEPVLSYSGSPNATTNDFRLRLTDSVPNASGALFWSPEPMASPFAARGGSWLIAAPRTRATFVSTDANGDTGDIPVAVLPAMVGTERYYQFLIRDPGAQSGTNYSTALHVDFCD